jgi:hypothetical protein
MYTELVLKCRIKKNVPEDVMNILAYLFDRKSEVEKPRGLPKHALFETPRWWGIGGCSSYYHHPEAMSSLYRGLGTYLFSRSDLKNYDNEIALFLGWLRPYLDHEKGECIGWEWYEEDEKPTLIFA